MCDKIDCPSLRGEVCGVTTARAQAEMAIELGQLKYGVDEVRIPEQSGECFNGRRHKWQTKERLTAWLDESKRIPAHYDYLRECTECGDHDLETITINE